MILITIRLSSDVVLLKHLIGQILDIILNASDVFIFVIVVVISFINIIQGKQTKSEMFIEN